MFVIVDFGNVVIADTLKSENKKSVITINDRDSATKYNKSIKTFYSDDTTEFSYPSPQRRKLNEEELKYIHFSLKLQQYICQIRNLTDAGLYYFKELRNLQAIILMVQK